MKKLMIALAATVAMTMSVVADVTVRTDVVLGEWTSNFTAAKEYADTNGVPMLVYWSNPGCSHCKKLEETFETSEFIAWQHERKMVMVFSVGDAIVKVFAKNSSLEYPYVAVYWNKGDGSDVILKKFTGRTGKMSYASGTLIEQFVNSIDISLDPSKTPYESPYVIENGVLIKVNLNGATDFAIPDGVVSIGDYAFGGCGGLESVTIPSSVTNIGNGVFSGCSGLSSITIPAGVVSIGDYAFYDCSFTSVTIPDSVTSIGTGAFSSCGGLTNISFGARLTNVGYEAFMDCPIRAVHISDVSSWFKRWLTEECVDDEPLWGYDEEYGWNLYVGNELVADLVIPDGVTELRPNAFLGCKSLVSVSIPGSVEYVSGGDVFGLFDGCSNLKCVKIGEGVRSVSPFAFNGCREEIFDTTTMPGLKLVDGWVVGRSDHSLLSGNLDLTGVRGVGDYAFSGCSELTSVKLPVGGLNLGREAFSGCSGLADDDGFIVVRGTLYGYIGKEWTITLPSTVTNIGERAFVDCEVTCVTIPDSVISIGAGAFQWCGLSSVMIGNGVASIGENAFACCAGLTNVTMGSGVRSIGEGAFCSCGLTRVIIPEGVTYIGESAFEDCCKLTRVSIPSTVEHMGGKAFASWNQLYDSNEDGEYYDFDESDEPRVALCVVFNVGDHPVTVDEFKRKPCSDAGPRLPVFPSEKTIEYVPASGYRFYGWKDSDGNVVDRPFHQRETITLYPDLLRETNPQTDEPVMTNVVEIVVTNFVESVVTVTNMITDHVTVMVTNIVEATNFVDVAVVATNTVELVFTNVVDKVAVQTNVIEIAAEAAAVPEDVQTSEPEAEFNGLDKSKMNGIVFDAGGTMRGVIQVETAKASAKGVKVKGFVMLEDGKKAALKAVTVPIEGGRLNVDTTVGKLGAISLTIGGDGFKGTFGSMKVVSADIGEDAGVLTGSLTLKYLDAAGKVKSRKIAVGGVATDGTAAGTVTPKGGKAKVFAAEVE